MPGRNSATSSAPASAEMRGEDCGIDVPRGAAARQGLGAQDSFGMRWLHRGNGPEIHGVITRDRGDDDAINYKD